MGNDLSASLSRRQLLWGGAALAAMPAAGRAAASPTLFAGSYARGGGPGLVPLLSAGGAWSAGTAMPAIANASFGVAMPRRGLRFLVDEQQQGRLAAYDRTFRRVAERSTLGADPCHAALDPRQSLLAAANYSSGDVALWRLNAATGLPEGEAQRIRHEGSGPNRDRQSSPHAHWVGFTADGGILHAVDLGADAIFAHRIDHRAGRVVATDTAYRAEPGSGPRHLARHPRLPIAYLAAELANTVTTLQAKADGSFAARGVLSTLPVGASAGSAVAHIAINAAGTRLYVSNRGHNSIAVFAIGADGALTLLQHAACGGNWPRFFLLLEERGEMLVANERSGTLVSLRVDRDGRLRPTGASLPIPSVVFVTP